jgi:hypothetical protein
VDSAASETTQDWLVPENSRPPLIGELERRIEEALVTARASEAAVMTVGAAAFDAAEQAKRAAELAERASASMLDASLRPELEPEPPAGGDRLRDFHARADFIASRLQKLQRMPLFSGGETGESQCDPVAG